MNLSLLRDVPKIKLSNKRVLLRVDFEVPIENGQVLDDFRIKAALPTIKYLFKAGAKILFLTKRGHLDIKPSPELSTSLLIPYLEKLLGVKVKFVKDFSESSEFTENGDNTCIFMFENLRFWDEEENNDQEFAKKLARLGDIYVSDNFGTAHRLHASVVALPQLLPSFAGFLLEQEITSLEKIVENPERPVVAILGGAKLETKLPLVRRFLQAGDTVLVGGGIANTIFFAKGYKLGESCSEKNSLQYLQNLDLNSKNLYLPIDGMIAQNMQAEGYLSKIDQNVAGECIFDIGPETADFYINTLKKAKTIFWNGPMGVTEQERFSGGTRNLAEGLRNTSAFKLVGGGDTISFFEQENMLSIFSHVSTGGGSMLEFLAGEKLPGIEVLKKKNEI